MVKNVTSHCFHESKIWKDQQNNSANSPYHQEKKKIADRKAGMVAALNTGLSHLNNDYKDVMATLGDKHVALNRFSCSKDDMNKLKSCHKKFHRVFKIY